MTFDRGDIRPAMDVYTKDNVYLGTVLAIVPGPPHDADHGAESASAPGGALEGSLLSGELLGPMPTQTIGNTGPIVQSARGRYASQPDDAAPLGRGNIIVGKWYGLLGKRSISLDAVQTVSLERVVLRLTRDEVTGSS